MENLSRVTGATVDVLRALLDQPSPIWGLRIIKATGRTPGTVYPILDRLEHAGWVTSRWDDDDTRPGPRRRFYCLTTEGARRAAAVRRDFDAARAARTSPRIALGGSAG